MILVMTDHPCLRVGRHNWYQSITGVIYRIPIFETTVRKCLDDHIRIIIVLTGGKLIVFKLCNYDKGTV
jgi:hypothetical protein